MNSKEFEARKRIALAESYIGEAEAIAGIANNIGACPMAAAMVESIRVVSRAHRRVIAASRSHALDGVKINPVTADTMVKSGHEWQRIMNNVVGHRDTPISGTANSLAPQKGPDTNE